MQRHARHQQSETEEGRPDADQKGAQDEQEKPASNDQAD